MLRTPRLELRRFAPADAAAVQRLAGAREVASQTLLIPHPYPDGAAEAWIAKHAEGAELTLAIDHGGELVGAIGLHIERAHDRAELGYWIGVPYWGRGFATEAARAIVAHGFNEHALNRIHAWVFTSNPASARVLEKIGMTREGVFREHFKKWDAYVDAECWGLVASRERQTSNVKRRTSKCAF